MEICPRHSDQDTMVPCIECGIRFCRICQPIPPTGQYCPNCHLRLISVYAEQIEATEADGLAAGPADGPDREPAEGTRAADEKVGRLASFLAMDATEFADWLSSALRLPGHRRTETAVGTPEADTGVQTGIEVIPVRKARRSKPRTAIMGGLAAVGRLNPICLKKKMPAIDVSLREVWWKLIIWTLAGAALWFALALIVHGRLTWVSLVAAVLVAVGVLISLEANYGIEAALLCMALSAMALMIGEGAIQVLINLGHYKSLMPKYMPSQSISGTFYYGLIVHRLLPAAAVAFLIGWWPLPKTFGWRGWRGAGEKSIEVGS